MEMKDQVGTYDLTMKDDVATNGSYLINLTIKKMSRHSDIFWFWFGVSLNSNFITLGMLT